MGGGWFKCTVCGMLVMVGVEAMHLCKKEEHVHQEAPARAIDLRLSQNTNPNTISGGFGFWVNG